MRLQIIENHDARHEVERQLLWLPFVALETSQSITGDAVADVIIRQLQFRVASTLDSDTLPEICERWMEDTKRIPHPEARSMMSGIMWFSFGFSQSLKVPLKHRFLAIARWCSHEIASQRARHLMWTAARKDVLFLA